jgi:hypothetical protein
MTSTTPPPPPTQTSNSTTAAPAPASAGPEDAPDLLRRMFAAKNSVLLLLAFCLITTIVSVIFESVNAAFSGLVFIALIALVALVVTFRLQYDELRLQRAELRNQHQAVDKSQKALHCSAEADIRALHVQLIKMSMDDEDLADVWPQYQGPVSAVRSKQNKYANLILQHQKMLYELGIFDRDDLISMVRYLFASPLIRSFWEGKMVARRVLNATTSREAEFDEIVDIAYRETEPPDPPKPPRTLRSAEVIDLDTRRNPESGAA